MVSGISINGALPSYKQFLGNYRSLGKASKAGQIKENPRARALAKYRQGLMEGINERVIQPILKHFNNIVRSDQAKKSTVTDDRGEVINIEGAKFKVKIAGQEFDTEVNTWSKDSEDKARVDVRLFKRQVGGWFQRNKLMGIEATKVINLDSDKTVPENDETIDSMTVSYENAIFPMKGSSLPPEAGGTTFVAPSFPKSFSYQRHGILEETSYYGDDTVEAVRGQLLPAVVRKSLNYGDFFHSDNTRFVPRVLTDRYFVKLDLLKGPPAPAESAETVA